jgi:hypothetical protein
MNPLVITFASPIDDFSVFIVNADNTQSYTVSDNLGDSVTKALPSVGSLGTAMFSLPGRGITSVFITSANADAWDFAIDDVSFAAATAVPEPQALFLVGLGSVLVVCVRRKQIGILLLKKASDRRSLL